MSPAPDTTRGTSDRGTGRSASRERNVPRGAVRTVVPDRNYNIVGFDIGSADLGKPGIREQLEPIVEQLQTRMGQAGRHPVVRVTGHASDSRLPGKGHDVYAANRAAAVKAYLVSRGIPGGWIDTDVSRSSPALARTHVNASPEQKAASRAATVEIGMSERRQDVAERFGDSEFMVGRPRRWLPSVPGFDALKHLPNPLPAARRLVKIGAAGAGMVLAAGGVLLSGVALLGLDEVLEVARHIYGRELGPASRQYLQKKVTENLHQHHVFVQRLMDHFVEAGINPHAFTARVGESLHDWLHRTGWNQTLYTFFELHGGSPAAEDIADFVGQMMEAWGISDLPLEPYGRKKTPR